MNIFLSAYLKLATLRQQYRRGEWWRVSYNARDHRSKMRAAQIELGAATRKLGWAFHPATVPVTLR